MKFFKIVKALKKLMFLLISIDRMNQMFLTPEWFKDQLRKF